LREFYGHFLLFQLLITEYKLLGRKFYTLYTNILHLRIARITLETYLPKKAILPNLVNVNFPLGFTIFWIAEKRACQEQQMAYYCFAI